MWQLVVPKMAHLVNCRAVYEVCFVKQGNFMASEAGWSITAAGGEPTTSLVGSDLWACDIAFERLPTAQQCMQLWHGV